MMGVSCRFGVGGPAMMTSENKLVLGRLERVELRKAWSNEATDFTPWLAQTENIKLLGEAIEIELEVEAQEKDVGPFRADILCKDTTTDHWVLIENQLERTDHVHLGQLLTYAAGLEAVTIVWIAARFSDEHRATLDWLNNITDSTFNFFGIEVELWRIGESLMAPKFNLVSKPNDWTKNVKQSASASQTAEASQSGQLHLAFWTQFRQFMQDQGSKLSIQRPKPQYWSDVGLGRTGYYISCMNGMRDGWSGVAFVVSAPSSLAVLNVIKDRYGAVLEELRAALQPANQLEWDESNKRKQNYVWLNVWMREAAERLHALFSPVVRTLDVDLPVPPSVNETESP